MWDGTYLAYVFLLQYVANKLHFELHSLSLTLLDQIDKKARKVLSMEVANVIADVLQKPTCGNVK